MAQNDGTMLVTYASLEQAATSIGQQADRLDQDLEALQGKIRSVSMHFEGEAKQAADSSHAEWDKETRQIHASLKSIEKTVREAAERYAAGDRKAASQF